MNIDFDKVDKLAYTKKDGTDKMFFLKIHPITQKNIHTCCSW